MPRASGERPPAAYFLPAAAKSMQKTPPKPRFWNPFRPTSGVSIGRCQTVELTFVLRRERFFISCPLHSTPKRVGLTPTTCNVRGARRKSRNHPVSGGVFFILFAAVGKKYAVGDTFLAQSTVVDKKYSASAESVQIIMDDAAFACCTLRAHRFPLYRLL